MHRTSPSGSRIVFQVARPQTCSTAAYLYPYYYCTSADTTPTYVELFDNVMAVSSDFDFPNLITGTGGSGVGGGTGTPPPSVVVRKDGTRLPAAPSAPSATLTTTNGNRLQANENSQSTTNYGVPLYDYLPATDTLGRTISYTNDDDRSSGQQVFYNTLETITLQDANGQPQIYRIKWKQISATNNYDTYFLLNDTLKVVDYITLPNGKQYQFAYNSEGMVSKVTLPSGAYIRYEYAHPCSKLRGHVVRRFLSADGTAASEKQTTYSYTYDDTNSACSSTGSSSILSTIVTDPSGGQTQHVFSPFPGRQLETTRLTLNGTEVLHRIDRSYDGTTYWDYGTNTAVYIPRLMPETTTMGSAVRKTQYSYDSYHNITRQEDYDWGSGAAGTRLRYVDKTYLTSACTSSGVCDRVTSMKTYTDSGTLVAETDYEYDNYSGSNALVTRSGTIPGWVAPAGVRGNVTAVRAGNSARGRTIPWDT